MSGTRRSQGGAQEGRLSIVPRIGFLTYDYSPTGGQGRVANELRRHLDGREHVELRVISPAPPLAAGDLRVGSAAARLGRNLGFSLAAGVFLSLWRDRLGLDLLHVNGGPGGVLLMRSAGLPVVYTAHHTYAQQARLVPGEGGKGLLSRLERRGYSLAAAVAADSPSTADSLVGELGLPAHAVEVIPCGVDTGLFRPLGLPKLGSSTLFVGRLDGRKGFLHLIEAWLRVARLRPEARLYVIGDGPHRARAEALLRDAGAGASVVFLGRTGQDELAAWYNRVDCVAVPSVFEGFGLVALEALACGTPVVATDSEGLRDVLDPQTDGSLVPYGDTEALTDALLEAMRVGGRVSSARRRSIAAAYAWPAIAERYLGLYEYALRRSPATAVRPAASDVA